MVKKTLVALAASLALTIVPSANASHSWNGYHWARSSNPFSLTIVDSVVGAWDSLLSPVSADWSASSVLNTSMAPGGTSLLSRLVCGAISGKIHVCNANYGPNLWFGQATVSIRNGHITQAVTQVNDFYFTGTYANNIARRHVLCQEVGHDFGLDHQHGVPTCMEDNNSTLNNPTYQKPNQHDYDELVTIYTHLDGGSGRGGRAATSPRPAKVEQIGDVTVLTFIYWVN
jgi:hypothetical protein